MRIGVALVLPGTHAAFFGAQPRPGVQLAAMVGSTLAGPFCTDSNLSFPAGAPGSGGWEAGNLAGFQGVGLDCWVSELYTRSAGWLVGSAVWVALSAGWSDRSAVWTVEGADWPICAVAGGLGARAG